MQRSDLELLCDAARGRSEAALAELVRRHLDLVYSTALRIAASPHLAEEISQQVFATLARDAAHVANRVERGTVLAAWLHVTTRNIAAQTVRSEVRRRAREQEAARMQELNRDSADWDRIAPFLDEALARLPETDRSALLLRYFEKKPAREIAATLGLSEAAAQKRLTRALDRLHAFLAPRAATLTAAGLASLLATHSIQAAPAALASACVASPVLLVALPAKTFLPLIMTKTHTAFLAGSAALIAVTAVVQQRSIAAHRTELAQLPAPLPAAVVAPTTPRDETAEIAQLRSQISAMRARLSSAAPVQPPKGGGNARQPGPLLLSLGRSVPAADLVYAGADSPEALLQSVLDAQLRGDPASWVELVLMSPKEHAEWVGHPELQDQIAAALKAEMHGYETIRLLGFEPIDEHRRQIAFEAVRNGAISTNRLTVAQTSGGWKLLLR